MKLLIAVFALFISNAVLSQIKVEIEEVLIEDKASNRAIEEQKESGTAKIVVSSKDLNNFGHHAAGDVLKRLPRIVMQGPPSFSRNIMMAGLDKQFQSVLINGERPAGGEDARDFKLDRIPMDMIEKIEVIYNPQASLGADATIGTVNIVLKDTPEKRIVNTGVSFDYTTTHSGVNPEFAVTLGNKWGKWSAMGSYSINSFKRTNINSLTNGEMSGTEDENLKVLINAFNGVASYKPDSNQTLTLHSFISVYDETAYSIADIKRRTKGGLNYTADTALNDKLRFLHSHTFKYKVVHNKNRWNTTLNFAQNIDSKERNRVRAKSSGVEETIEDEDQINTEFIGKCDFIRKNMINTAKHVFKAGIRASGLSRDFSRLVYTKMQGNMFWGNIEDGSYNLHEYRVGAYLADELHIGKFWVSPAVRFDYDFADYNTVDTTGNSAYKSLNPSLHLKCIITKNFFIKADIARQISRPPFNSKVPVDKVKHKKELIERGNPELEPSRAWNFGLGGEKYFGKSSYITCRGFYSVLHNVIEKREVGIDDYYNYRIFQSVNVDSGLVWGVDIDAKIGLSQIGVKGLALSGNFSWLGSQVRDPETYKLRRLNNQPVWIANGTIDYLNTQHKFQVSFGVNYIGKRVTAETITDGTKVDALIQTPFLQFDARIKYFFANWGSVYLNCINIFNETIDYKQAAVTESEVIGRNIVLGVSMHF